MSRRSSTEMSQTKVYRGGVTSRYVNYETKEVRLQASTCLDLTFKMDSKGGGRTYVSIQIESGDFPRLLSAMCQADRQAAMVAMSTELGAQIALQHVHDTNTAHAAQEAIRNLAEQKYVEAPAEDDYEERLVSAKVRKLIEEIRKAEPN